MPGFIYAQDSQGAIYVNLYVSSETSFRVGASVIRLTVDSGMPWSGTSRMTVTTSGEHPGTIKLRVPGWARNQPVPSHLYTYVNRVDTPVSLSVNGNSLSALPDAAGYVSIDRTWKNGDLVVAEFPMEARRVAADQRVTQNRRRGRDRTRTDCTRRARHGRQGPRLLLEPAAGLQSSAVRFLWRCGRCRDRATRVTNPSLPRNRSSSSRSLWANQGPGEMTVWLSTAGYAIGDTGPAAGSSSMKTKLRLMAGSI
jgi:hypothetical protein